MSTKVKTIKRLVDSSGKRAYVYFSDKETQEQFVFDADVECYTFNVCVEISDRIPDDFYTRNHDKTVDFINAVGRVVILPRTKNIVRIDCEKFTARNEGYYYG